MNIFAVDKTPDFAARQLCDKHVVKMILESAQILSTVHHLIDGDSCRDGLYKATHIHHPSVVWVAERAEHYNWLSVHLEALCDEYSDRYGRCHKTQEDGIVSRLIYAPKKQKFYNGEALPLTVAMAPEFKFFDVKNWDDVTTAYRLYYVLDKERFAKWKMGNEPVWFTQGKQCLSTILDAKHATMSSKEIAESLKEKGRWENLAHAVRC